MNTVGRTVIAAIVVASLFVVAGGKLRSFGKNFIQTSADHCNGDLYEMCQIDYFKETIPLVRSGNNNSFADSDIIVIGDSFFNVPLGSEIFANELGKRIAYTVYNVPNTGNYFEQPVDYPLAYLNKQHSGNDKKKILILESIERFSIDRSRSYNVADPPVKPKSELKRVFDHADVKYFFEHNVFFNPVVRFVKNARFALFGFVDSSVGGYSEKPPMLFYQEDVLFRRQGKSAGDIEDMALRIDELSRVLNDRYNIVLLYVMIPDKYSVYSAEIKNGCPYDNFIPKVCKELKGRGVNCIDMYSVYAGEPAATRPMLYYGADYHYTPYGKQLLVGKCIEEIGRMHGNNRND